MIINISVSSRKGNILTSYQTAVETERSIDHIGSEKNPLRNVQQWGILVNSLTAEPVTWRNESAWLLMIAITISIKF
jgi:predicted nucleotide-binding protein (sugar kinase/HSP70/actin superfamily)